MIIHRWKDGSEAFQYEAGDRVIVTKTINGGWFDYGPTRAERCTVRKVAPFSRGSDLRPFWWMTATLHIHYSDDWGLATCSHRGVEPHPETRAKAQIVEVRA